MYVTLLFDIEDLVDPRSDDVTLRIMDIFAEESAPATMMIVGEKARLWEKRGRRDLIESAARHDIGLHTNRHSMHPTVAEYLEGKGWEDGIAEVVARERSGAEDMTRILGRVPSCWGRGGSTWGPQVAPALPKIGVPAMIYPFTHLNDPRKHVHRFCNTLCYYWYYGGYDSDFSDDAAFVPAWEEAKSHIDAGVRDGVPWLALFVCHPATVRAKHFWDYLNFNRGINTPPEQWRMPEYRSDAEWQVAQRNLRRLASEVGRLPGVQLRTIRDLNRLVARYPESIAPAELVARARAAAAGPDIGPLEAPLSPAETLYLWALWLQRGRTDTPLPYCYVEGPIEEPPADEGPVSLDAAAIEQLAGAVVHAVDADGRLPAAVSLGGRLLGIGTAYRALAAACAGGPGAAVTAPPGPQAPAIGDQLHREVSEGVPGWMHKPDLDVSTHAAFTRLQSWTLKPVQLG